VSWIEIGLLLLRLASSLLDYARARQQFTAGQDAEAARASAAILARTQAGKQIMEKLDAMSEGDLGRLLSELAEPER
jgi:hypothetical protein